MFAKSTAVFALFTVAARLAVAAPPACMIAAVNTQPDPSALKAVCSGNNATEVEQYMCKNCGDNADLAMKDFSEVCSGAGVTIDSDFSCSKVTSSSSSSTSGTASTTSTASGTQTADSQGSINTGMSGISTLSPTGTVAPSGVATVTGSQAGDGTLMAATGSAPAAASTGSGGSGSGSSGGSSASASTSAKTSAAERLGMDIVGLVAVGAFGAMLAM